MAKRSKAVQIAFKHAAGLPAFESADIAKAAYFDLLTAHQDRLRALVAADGGPKAEPSAEALRALELWAFDLSDAQLEALGTTRGELGFLLFWHLAVVAVR